MAKSRGRRKPKVSQRSEAATRRVLKTTRLTRTTVKKFDFNKHLRELRKQHDNRVRLLKANAKHHKKAKNINRVRGSNYFEATTASALHGHGVQHDPGPGNKRNQNRTKVCKKRLSRRRALFTTGKAGYGKAGPRQRKYTQQSRIKC